MRKKILTGITIFALCFGMTGGPILSAEDEQEEIKIRGYEIVETEGENYGHIPISYTVPVSESDSDVLDNYNTGLHGSGTLPARYDARDYGYVTAVKDQGYYGTCWAFAAISSAESDAIIDGRNSNPDYSEAQLAFFTYNRVADPLGGTTGDKVEVIADGEDYLSIGGNNYYTTMALASWISPADETTMDYDDIATKYTGITSVDESYDYEACVAHLQNSYWISMSDPDSIKQMIMEYGSLDSSLYYSDDYLEEVTVGNTTKWLFYNPEEYIQNHEISLVGWDDTIDADLFSKTIDNVEYTPAGDGAWLVKNSYGDYYHDEGYFWISYYDTSLMYTNSSYNVATAYDFEAVDNYDYNYQYDGSYATFEVYDDDYNESIYTANVFTAKNSAQQLEAVAFYTTLPNMKYSIQVYKVDEAGTPVGEALLTKAVEGLEPYSGYHTVKLNERIILNEGEKFSVVVKNTITTDGYVGIGATAFLDASNDDGYLRYTSSGESGQSYLSFDGVNWEDMYDRYGANLRVKAFTNYRPVESVAVEEDTYTIGVGEQLQLFATVSPENATVQSVTWSGLNDMVLSVSKDGIVTGLEAGSATVTVKTVDGGKTAKCTVIVKDRYITPDKPVLKSRTEDTITVEAVADCIYSLDGIDWQDSNVFTDLEPGTEYSIYAMIPGDEYYYQSELSEPLVVSTYDIIEAVKLNYTDIALVIDEQDTIQLKATTVPADVKVGTVTWKSEDENITIVDENGLVTGLSMGETNIVATSDADEQISAICKVGVYKRYATPSAPTLASKTHSSITLSKVSGAVYSKDGKTWQSSNVFTGLNPETTYTFYVKLLQNGYYMESKVSAGLKVTTAEKPFVAPDIKVSYRTHIQSFGWEYKEDEVTKWKANGAMSGTSGLAKRLEGINIVVAPTTTCEDLDLGIQYTTHCQSYGWLPWSADGDMNGTEGEAKRLEAIMIQLTGEHKELYDVYYRVHAQSYGWLGWAKNGEPSGTAGYAKRLEGIQIVVVKKGESYNQKMEGITSARTEAFVAKAGSSPIVNYPATSNTNPVVPGADDVNVAYRTHVQSFGWQGWKYNGQMSGTSGLAKRLEGIEINLTNKDYDGGIAYATHVQTYGWQGADLNKPSTWKHDGQMAGTSGEAKRLEAICITLTGEMAEHYDIYYRVHAQSYGWLGWAKNGEASGTAGYAKRLEGIQIVIVPKGGKAPTNHGGIISNDTRAYIEK